MHPGKFKFDGKAAPGYFLGLEHGCYKILTNTHKVIDVPHGEVVFQSGSLPETGGNKHHAGGQDVGLLDLPHNKINSNSSMLKDLHSNNLGQYWELEESDQETGTDNNVVGNQICVLFLWQLLTNIRFHKT